MKWPAKASKNIFIQQDNARLLIKDSDIDFRATRSHNGFNIRLVQQPANNPDTNMNDLGFFHSIQALQMEAACKTVKELMNAMDSSFKRLSALTLDNMFLSL